MNWMEKMKKTNIDIDMDYEFDSSIQNALIEFFSDNSNYTIDDVSQFINDMLTDICRQFANETETMDPKKRIEEFNKKIYTIMKNADITALTSKSEQGKNLYGKLFEFLQSEQFPTGKEYSPQKDRNQIMSKTEIECRDYEIRKKYIQHIIDTYASSMPSDLFTYLESINEQFKNRPIDMNTMYFGRMNMQNAAFMKRIIFDLGYRVNLDDLLIGKEISTDKIEMGSQKDVFKSGEVREQDDFCFTQAEYKRLQEYAENLNGLEKYFRQIIGLKQYDEFGFPIEEESETPITDAMRAWGEEEKESETPITDAMRAWGEEEKESETPITDAMRAWGEEEKESETPITDAMRAWGEEEKESETPITDAMRAWGEEEKESETPITDAMRAWDEEEKESETPITDAMRTWNEEKKTIKTDPYIKALLDRLIKSGGILIPSQHLKIQQGDFQKIANVPSEASIKAGYKAHSLEGVYERRNIKMSQIQKANQVIHESSQNKDEQQNEQEGGTDYDQH